MLSGKLQAPRTIGATSATGAGRAGSFALMNAGLRFFAKPLLGRGHQRDHALVGFPRIGAEAEDAVLHQDQAFDRWVRVEHLRRGLGEAEARHHVGHIADARAKNLAAQRFAVGLVGERKHRRRMGVIDEFVRNERVQQRLDRRIGRGRIDQIGALQPHHLFVGKIFARTKFYQRREPHRGQARGLDRAHVPAGALDAKNVDGVAVEIGDARLHRGVAAAVQHQARVLAEQTRGINPERQVAAEVFVSCDRRVGVAIIPGALHALFLTSFGGCCHPLRKCG